MDRKPSKHSCEDEPLLEASPNRPPEVPASASLDDSKIVPKARWTKPLEWWGTRQLIRTLNLVGRATPPRLLAPMGRSLGMAAFHGMRRYRTVALNNLRAAYGAEWDDEKIQRLARASFQHLGITLVEFFLRQPRITDTELEREVRFEGQQHFEEAFRRGRGVIVVSAHYGNWEIMGPRLALAGYRVSGVSRVADDPGLEQMISHIRKRAGLSQIPRRRAAREGLAALRRNEILAILLDQNTAEGGVFVPFFGRPASTAMGPAVFALKTGAAIVPTFSMREVDGTHTMKAWPPIFPQPTGDRNGDVLQLTSEVTRVIELQIRERPELWCWLHNRWKRQPTDAETAPVVLLSSFGEKGSNECKPSD